MSRIVQILESYAYGDGIGNHVTALHRELKNRNVGCEIYANSVDTRLSNLGSHISKYVPKADDVILYHLSTGSVLNRTVPQYGCRLLINYHNITPPEFFEPYNAEIARGQEKAYADAAFLADKAESAVSDSEYNSSELAKMGYQCPLYNIPIFMDFSDYDKTPDPAVIEKYRDGVTNIVFVGRIAPNKKQEDIIKDFYYYTKHFNPNSRLIFVGNYRGFEQYYLKLKAYVKKLGLNNVVFTGHIKFTEILAFYHTADLLLCESAHEGFCIPLVEAMYFGVPIVAYDSSAISETLGAGGILLKQKNPKLAAAVMDQVLRDDELRKEILQRQDEELKRFHHKVVATAYMKYLLGD